MRKLEKQMWTAILDRLSWSSGNLEVLPTLLGVAVNAYQCRLADIEFIDHTTLKITFKGDCWDGASKTVMSRVRALACGYEVKKSGSSVTFKHIRTASSMTHDVKHLSSVGWSCLVSIEQVRLAIQP